MDNLPNEILVLIDQNLPPWDRIKMTFVTKQWPSSVKPLSKDFNIEQSQTLLFRSNIRACNFKMVFYKSFAYPTVLARFSKNWVFSLIIQKKDLLMFVISNRVIFWLITDDLCPGHNILKAELCNKFELLNGYKAFYVEFHDKQVVEFKTDSNQQISVVI